MVSFCSPFKAPDLLADPLGEVFRHKTALYERFFEPLCKVMDAQILEGTILGGNGLFREYASIARWPIRKLEYSFVLHHALPLMEARQRSMAHEAGCGVTPLPHLFAMMGAEVDAVDYAAHTIEALKTGNVNEIYGFPVNHQWMDLRRLAFPDSSFDLITCVSVIEHVANGAQRVLCSCRPDLVISVRFPSSGKGALLSHHRLATFQCKASLSII